MTEHENTRSTISFYALIIMAMVTDSIIATVVLVILAILTFIGISKS